MQVYAASLTGVIRTILIILALYFAVRVLGRLLRPLLYGKKSNPSATDTSDSRRDGEVRIEYPRKDKSRKGNNGRGDDGDYIDFEEVD